MTQSMTVLTPRGRNAHLSSSGAVLRDDGGVNAFPISSGEACRGEGEALITGGSRIPATIPPLISRFAVMGGVGRNMAMGAESGAMGEVS